MMKWTKVKVVVLMAIVTGIIIACAPLIVEVSDKPEGELPTEVQQATTSSGQAEAASSSEASSNEAAEESASEEMEEAASGEQVEEAASEEVEEAASGEAAEEAATEEIEEEAAPEAQMGSFTLTILHNNDGESRLINAGGDNVDFGGVARFATLVSDLRAEAVDESGDSGAVLLSSGDNFLASPEFSASQEKGIPFYDTIAIDLIGYDAMAIGNHEFDFGPKVLADFIEGFGGSLPFVSANLDFSEEADLQELVAEGVIVKSLVIDEEGQQIGIVGATTPQLFFISSPGKVKVDDDVAGTIQAEIDALEADGINKIIIISHLQSINEDLDLAGQLSGVDVMIAGGGDELLADESDLLVPGDEEPFGPYPLTATGADGTEIPVVTTPGDYKYVGRLIVTFDEDGQVDAIGEDSGLVRVAGGDNPDAVTPDPELQAQVVDPVEAHIAGLAENVIATSEVALEGRRSPGVRTMETNEGNLMADALRWQATLLADEYGADMPQVALQNGGGIRNNNLISAESITELDTFSIAPFPNFVTIVSDISPDHFKEIMENAVSQVEDAGGRFAQISGFKMVYDISGTAQELDEEANVVTAGTRVREIVLDDGTVIVQDGAVVDGAPSINVATIDFLARGGDQYPFRDAPITLLGVSYQQALSNYITESLGGAITAAQYPEGGEGRILEIEGGEMATAADEVATTTEAGAAVETEGEDAATAEEGATTEAEAGGEEAEMAEGEEGAMIEEGSEADAATEAGGEEAEMAEGEETAATEESATAETGSEEAEMAEGEEGAMAEEGSEADAAAEAGGEEAEMAEGEEAATEEGATAETGSEEAEMTEGEAMSALDMCAEDYTIQVDDWLSKISERFLGNMFAYPLIFQATNAAAEVGGSYATITDPDIIEVGQVLCIPSDKDGAMMEDGAATDKKSVVDVAVEDGRFSTLVTAIETAGLDKTLRGKGPFTIFAPTDEAFAALPEGELARMLADIPTLTSTLLCHVVMGEFTAADLASLSAIDTVGGQHVTFAVEGDMVQVNEAQITTADIKADNGVIHIIDAVILPPSQ